jgi:hypothetical protein
VIRRVLAIAAVGALVVACDRDSWKQTAPFAPSLRPAFGVRVTDGELRIWTGSPCVAVTRLDLTFDPYQDDRAELVLTPSHGRAPEVEHLVLGGPYPGLEVATPLPAGFTWRTAESMMFSVDREQWSWGSTADIAEIIKGSAAHPEDTYWFQDVGWLNPAEVAAQDGKTFLTTCAPDPAKLPSLPPVFGARVTDGKLRIWAGGSCASTTGLRLVFDPSSAVLELGGAHEGSSVDFEYFTLGEPYPGLKVTQSLPEGFAWRTQETVVLSVYGRDSHVGLQTDLAAVITGSADHPDDTFWFQDVGWLNPARVAEQDGKTFLATCTPDPGK